jgi:hypothetical protein
VQTATINAILNHVTRYFLSVSDLWTAIFKLWPKKFKPHFVAHHLAESLAQGAVTFLVTEPHETGNKVSRGAHTNGRQSSAAVLNRHQSSAILNLLQNIDKLNGEEIGARLKELLHSLQEGGHLPAPPREELLIRPMNFAR